MIQMAGLLLGFMCGLLIATTLLVIFVHEGQLPPRDLLLRSDALFLGGGAGAIGGLYFGICIEAIINVIKENGGRS